MNKNPPLGCPFHNREDYKDLSNLERLSKKSGLNESVKYLSYDKKLYPGMKDSMILNKLLKNEIKYTFENFNNYINSLVEGNSIEDLLKEYDKLILHHGLDESRLQISKSKSFDYVMNMIEEKYLDNDIINRFYNLVTSNTKIKGYSIKDGTKDIMRSIHLLILEGNTFIKSLDGLCDRYGRLYFFYGK